MDDLGNLEILANWDEVADDGALPSMRANAVLSRWEVRLTSTERLMINVGWQIEDPQKYAGMFVNDNLIIGGDAGSGKEKSFDASQQDSRRLRGMLEAMSVPLNSDVKLCMKSAEGGKVSMVIAAPSEKDIAAGFDRNRVRKYHQLGSVEPGELASGPRQPVAAPSAPPPPPPPALPQQPPPGVD